MSLSPCSPLSFLLVGLMGGGPVLWLEMEDDDEEDDDDEEEEDDDSDSDWSRGSPLKAASPTETTGSETWIKQEGLKRNTNKVAISTGCIRGLCWLYFCWMRSKILAWDRGSVVGKVVEEIAAEGFSEYTRLCVAQTTPVCVCMCASSSLLPVQ